MKKKILPEILLLPKGTYAFKGSFKRKAMYVTDIDIVQDVYPKINKTNIYEKIIKLIKKTNNNNKIIIIQISCGTDDRFKLSSVSNKDLKKIRTLLNDKELKNVNFVIEKYQDDPEKQLFYVNELIWDFYKLRWTYQEVLDNKKILKGNIEITFEEALNNSPFFLIQYFAKIGTNWTGIDLITIYDEYDIYESYKINSEYQIRSANYAREYYFMLYPLKYYFKINGNYEVYNEINEIIEQKFGLYKQLLVNIDGYLTLYKKNKLNIATATEIVTNLVRDIKNLSNFQSKIPEMIKEVAIDNPPEIKLRRWNILLESLFDELNTIVNRRAREYFMRYLDLMPPEKRKEYYIDLNRDRISDIKRIVY